MDWYTKLNSLIEAYTPVTGKTADEKLKASKAFWNAANAVKNQYKYSSGYHADTTVKNSIDIENFHIAYDDILVTLEAMELFGDNGLLKERNWPAIDKVKTTADTYKDDDIKWASMALAKLYSLQFKESAPLKTDYKAERDEIKAKEKEERKAKIAAEKEEAKQRELYCSSVWKVFNPVFAGTDTTKPDYNSSNVEPFIEEAIAKVDPAVIKFFNKTTNNRYSFSKDNIINATLNYDIVSDRPRDNEAYLRAHFDFGWQFGKIVKERKWMSGYSTKPALYTLDDAGIKAFKEDIISEMATAIENKLKSLTANVYASIITTSFRNSPEAKLNEKFDHYYYKLGSNLYDVYLDTYELENPFSKEAIDVKGYLVHSANTGDVITDANFIARIFPQTGSSRLVAALNYSSEYYDGSAYHRGSSYDFHFELYFNDAMITNTDYNYFIGLSRGDVKTVRGAAEKVKDTELLALGLDKAIIESDGWGSDD